MKSLIIIDYQKAFVETSISNNTQMDANQKVKVKPNKSEPIIGYI